jgi:hypothetical protein
MNTARISRHLPFTALTKRILVVMIICMTFSMMVSCQKKKPEALPPPVVEVVEVIQKDVPIYDVYKAMGGRWVNEAEHLPVQQYDERGIMRENATTGVIKQ